MARRSGLSQREQRQNFLYSAFSQDELNDPRVQALLKNQDEQRAAASHPADFSNVQANSDTVEQPQSLGQRVYNTLRPLDQGATDLRNIAGQALTGGLETTLGSPLFASGDLQSAVSQDSGMAAPSNPLSEVLRNLIPGSGLIDLADPTGRARSAIGAQAVIQGQQNKQASVDAARKLHPLGETLSVGVADMLGSPSSLVSIFGGPGAAGIAGADTFLQQYAQDRIGGASRLGSAIEAVPQAGIEAGISAIPAGKFLKKVPIVKALANDAELAVKGTLERTIKRVGMTIAGEGTEEGLTTVAQLATDKAIATLAPNTDAGKAAQSNIPVDMVGAWDQIKRSAVAGGIGGGALGGPVETMHTVAENAQRLHDLQQEAADAANKKKAKVDVSKYVAEDKPKTNAIDFAKTNADEIARLDNVISTNQDIVTKQQAAKAAHAVKAASIGETAKPFDTTALDTALSTIKSAQRVKDRLLGNPVPADNPTNTTESTSAPTAPKKKAPNRKKVQSQMEQFAGRKMEGDQTEGNGPDAATVLTSLTNDVGSKTTGIIHGLISKGNLKVVNDASEVPVGAEKRAGLKGYYDGNTTYVVASQLDQHNPVGDLLDTAAHEVHHAAQASGAVKMSSFVGDNSANKLVHNIEKLAEVGDPTAQKVVDAAKNSEEANPGSYRDEVLGYAVSAQRAARNKNSRFGRTVGNIVSAVRTHMGVDAGFHDVAYLSDKLLQKAAASDKSFKAIQPDPNTVVTRNMMVPDLRGSVSDRHFYSIDETHKFEVSDRNSNLRHDVIDRLRREGVDAKTTVGELLNHPRLYHALDQAHSDRKFLTDMPVIFRPLGDNYVGMFSESQHAIFLNSNLLGEHDAAQWNGPIHRVLIHEVQHVIQNHGGSEAGTNAQYLALKLDPEARRLDQTIQAQQDKVQSSQKIVDTFDRIINHPQTDAQEKERLQRNRQTAWNNYQKDRAKLQDLKKQFEDKVHEHFPLYEGALGEREARRAEYRIPRSQATIDSAIPGAHEGEYLANGTYTAEGQLMEPRTTEQLQHMQDFTNPKEQAPAGWGRAINTQNLKDIVEETSADTRKFKDSMVKWLTNDNVYFGRDLNTIKEAASGMLTSLVHKSEVYGTRLKNAIRESAKNLGMDSTKIEEDIKTAVDKIDGLKDEAVRKSAIRALDRKYPGVGKALNDLRDLKLEFARQIIAQRLTDINERPLSKKEAAIFKKIIANAETYNTRAYLASINKDISLRYGRNVLRTANRDPNSTSGKVVQNAMEWIKAHDLVIPPRETLADQDYDTIKRIYETWIGKAPKGNKGQAKDTMVSRLEAMPEKTQEEINDKAYHVVKDLLGMTPQATAIGTYYRGARQNRTILQSRKNVPGPIRELMGEITHPVVREMITLSRMSQLVAKTQMLVDIHQQGKDLWWSDHDSENFPLQINGEDFGPLDGKFVTARVHDLLASSVQLEQTLSAQVHEALVHPEKFAGMILGPVATAGRKASTLYKTAALAYNPFAMFRNWMGSHMMAIQNGLLPGSKDWALGMYHTAIALTASQTKQQSDKNLSITAELQKAGVLDSATMGEFKTGFYNDMFQQIAHLDPTEKTFNQRLDDILKKYIKGRDSKLGQTNDTMRTIYAGMDMWVKPATYFNRKAYLKAYYEANGVTKTEDELIREAGYDTNLTNITYTNANPAVRILEKYAAPIAMFLTYYTEVFRAHIGSFAMIARDVQKARTATSGKAAALAYAQASKRLVGTLAVTYGLNAAILGILGAASDEEKRKRFLDAAWEKYDILINIGKTKDGNEVMMGLSQIDPNGPLNEPMRAVLAAKDDHRGDAIMGAVQGLFTQSRSAFAIFHILQDVGVHAVGLGGTEADHPRKKNTQLQQNWPKAYEALSNALRAGDVGENTAELLDTLVPGFLRGAYKMNSPDQVASGVNKPLGTAIEKMGGNLYIRKPELDMGFKIRDYTKAVTGLKTQLRDFLADQHSPDVATVVKELQTLKEKEFKMYGDLNDAWSGYMAYNPSHDQASKTLHDNRLFSSTSKALIYGRFESEVVTPDTIEKWHKDQLKNTDDKERVDQVYRILREAYTETNK